MEGTLYLNYILIRTFNRMEINVIQNNFNMNIIEELYAETTIYSIDFQ